MATPDGRLGTWLGRAWGLGENAIYYRREPLLVSRSPLDWLRNSRRGVVVVNCRMAARFLSARAAIVPLRPDLAWVADAIDGGEL